MSDFGNFNISRSQHSVEPRVSGYPTYQQTCLWVKSQLGIQSFDLLVGILQTSRGSSLCAASALKSDWFVENVPSLLYSIKDYISNFSIHLFYSNKDRQSYKQCLMSHKTTKCRILPSIQCYIASRKKNITCISEEVFI
jgi:hypothetical protein